MPALQTCFSLSCMSSTEHAVGAEREVLSFLLVLSLLAALGSSTVRTCLVWALIVAVASPQPTWSLAVFLMHDPDDQCQH